MYSVVSEAEEKVTTLYEYDKVYKGFAENEILSEHIRKYRFIFEKSF